MKKVVGFLSILLLVILVSGCSPDEQPPQDTVTGVAKVTIVPAIDCGSSQDNTPDEIAMEACFAEAFTSCSAAKKTHLTSQGQVTMELTSACDIIVSTITVQGEQSQQKCSGAYLSDSKVSFGPDTSCIPIP